MKLVAVMSLDAYRDDLHRLYREREIEVYSEIDIRGYHRSQASGTSLGWFGRSVSPAYSSLTWSFLPDDQARALLDALATFNADRDLQHPVRAFQMPVDRSV